MSVIIDGSDRGIKYTIVWLIYYRDMDSRNWFPYDVKCYYRSHQGALGKVRELAAAFGQAFELRAVPFHLAIPCRIDDTFITIQEQGALGKGYKL